METKHPSVNNLDLKLYPAIEAKTLSMSDYREILRAVNSHAALLEAAKIGLEQIKMAISDAGSCDHSVGLCVCPLIQDAERIQRAITQAEKVRS